MSQNTSFLTLLPPTPYLSLSDRRGKLPFPLTNDYLFKVVFQTDETILGALLCSLLDLMPKDIHSIVITNPFVLGATAADKDTVLDIRLVLNNDSLINLEMQIKNERDWPERSLCYLCRTFDNLGKGASYLDVKPAHHIGILNFNLPHVQKQFYSHYFMINEMLAKEDALFQKVSDALYLISENRELAEQCRRMQEAEARQAYWQGLQAQLDAKNHALAEKEAELEQLRTQLRKYEESKA